MTTSAGSPRTLADALRAAGDDALAELLRARPDLLSPLPGDLSQLATRAATRVSVLRALEHLDTFTLQVAEALAVAPQPCPYETLAGLLPGAEERVPRAVDTLRTRALVWGGPGQLRLVRTVQELLAPTAQRPSSTGLGPTLAEAASGMSPRRIQELLTAAGLRSTPDSVSALAALASLVGDTERMTRLLDAAPEPALAVLERLKWGPPYGEISARPAPHLRWLLDRGLLIPVSPGTVALPREVALHLRGGRAHRTPRPLPPELTAQASHDPHGVDAAAAGQAHAALAVVEELLNTWGREGPPVLRAGGLGVRDQKRTAVALDLPEPEAVFWIELAYAAGLVAADGEANERYAPTPAYDSWLEGSPETRWGRLIAGWLTSTRVPGLAGGRDSKGRALAALGPGLDRGPAAELRRGVLRLLAEAPAGTAPEPAAVRERLTWEQPRRMPAELRRLLCEATLAEAERLGVTGRGALASYSRPLVRPPAPEPGDPEAAEAARTGSATDTPLPEPTGPETTAAVEAAVARLAVLLPRPLDHFLLQADLTAVAPGPLERDLAHDLSTIADIESRGAATVYRFSPDSVRRALDSGWSAPRLHAFLAERSRTPVPQPLSYLVDDTARRHGHLRVGAASAYLRCDDESLIEQLLADRRSESLRLRRIAPTVLVTTAAPGTLLEQLRELGFAPAAESAEGGVVTVRHTAHRTPPRRAPEPAPDSPPTADDTLLAAAVRAIRTGDHATGTARPAARVTDPADGRREVPRTPADETLAALRSAARGGALVRIGYVGADGVAAGRVLEPVRVEGGFVTSFDHTAEEVRTYPLHRITGAVLLPGEAPASGAQEARRAG
ncbi:helicase-associated domain-containing protein [Streptomyces sodiiphilus]|uniref:Helicase-associated domain-containing protein n=1 Tax=Streptomyces sodiiphilus TaxID=226217 RepID=A0ABN2NSZ6_9ACTN